LLHYAVESEARLENGLWGLLANGTTLAQLREPAHGMGEQGADLAAIEQIVGALHDGAKGRSTAALAPGLRRFAQSLGASIPDWLDEALIDAVRERMRQLLGVWRATPYGGSMDLEWTVTRRHRV